MRTETTENRNRGGSLRTFSASRWAAALVGLVVLLGSSSVASAADDGGVSAVGLNTLWVTLAAALVFFMQAGFGMVEAGFIRSKNTCNILTKNFVDYCSASLMFFIVGYAFMFGSGNGFIGWEHFGLSGVPAVTSGVDTYAFWFFQAAFCGAAATIVAGGMAGRMKFGSYLLYTIVISGLVYPIVGHWIWGGGWLSQLDTPFQDFAGSTVVHATGGWAALIGTILLGPRIGKYVNGKVRAIQGHNIPIASLGVFILWFGWFGFNCGSGLAVGDGSSIARVAINTNLAAAMGTLGAMLVIWLASGKPDLGMMMNGALAGLVAITAPCDVVAPWAACLIGLVGGVLVVLATLLLDKLKIDDPVGAWPVHGVNGVWGTIALGLFAAEGGLFTGGGLALLGTQVLGVVSVVGFVLVTMGTVFLIIKKTMGLRVSREEELKGLDIGEHGMEAYAGFQIFVTS